MLRLCAFPLPCPLFWVPCLRSNWNVFLFLFLTDQPLQWAWTILNQSPCAGQVTKYCWFKMFSRPVFHWMSGWYEEHQRSGNLLTLSHINCLLSVYHFVLSSPSTTATTSSHSLLPQRHLEMERSTHVGIWEVVFGHWLFFWAIKGDFNKRKWHKGMKIHQRAEHERMGGREKMR